MREAQGPDLPSDEGRGHRPTPETPPKTPSGTAAVVDLPTLYAKSARQSDDRINVTTATGTLADRTRRIVHFVDPWEDWLGRSRWRQVVTLVPGRRLWIAHTIDPSTGIPESWACYGPDVDPFEALVEEGQTVIQTHYRRSAKRGMIRHWYGYRIRDSVDQAKWLLGYDVPRARKPYQLRNWLLDLQNPNQAPSKWIALKWGIRGFRNDLSVGVRRYQ